MQYRVSFVIIGSDGVKKTGTTDYTMDKTTAQTCVATLYMAGAVEACVEPEPEKEYWVEFVLKDGRVLNLGPFKNEKDAVDVRYAFSSGLDHVFHSRRVFDKKARR